MGGGMDGATGGNGGLGGPPPSSDGGNVELSEAGLTDANWKTRDAGASLQWWLGLFLTMLALLALPAFKALAAHLNTADDVESPECTKYTAFFKKGGALRFAVRGSFTA